MDESDNIERFVLEDYRMFCREVMRTIYESNGPQGLDRVEQVVRPLIAARKVHPPFAKIHETLLTMIDADLAAVRKDPDMI